MQAEKDEKEDENQDRYGPPLPGNFGFHHPFDFVEETLSWLRLSHYLLWPERGGWAEQDAFLVEDVKRYMALERRQRWEVDHPDRFEPEPDDDAPRIEGALKLDMNTF